MITEKIREIRINPIIPVESVLIATERGGRPEIKLEHPVLDRRSRVVDCQFCRGNEDQTPTEILQLPGDGEWQIRVVRNLYPVFGDDHIPSDLNLARILLRVMLRLQAVIGFVAYNYFLHSAPAESGTLECESSFHWHLELCPRTTIPNGFELGSGLAISEEHTNQLLELIQQNTQLTEITKQLSERIELLTIEMHARILQENTR